MANPDLQEAAVDVNEGVGNEGVEAPSDGGESEVTHTQVSMCSGENIFIHAG